MKIRSLLEFDDPSPEYDPKSRLFTLCLNFGGKFTLGPQSTYVRGESYKFDYVELDSLLFESLEKLAIHEGVLGPMRFCSELEPGYLLINNTTDLHKVIEEKLTKVREVNIFIEELSNEVFNDGNIDEENEHGGEEGEGVITQEPGKVGEGNSGANLINEEDDFSDSDYNAESESGDDTKLFNEHVDLEGEWLPYDEEEIEKEVPKDINSGEEDVFNKSTKTFLNKLHSKHKE
ncbi:hypothetical protein DH2020_014735 [Rehmannia glutinosa]|uniref:Uncharacterized protein n=1 Tax=Rehmannia glutinosa TaxID=99300 RepID=A0ABR0X173_REHGL